MIHSLAAAAILLAQAAPASERCLTREEAGDIALTATSIAMNALAEHCRPHVPADAFLNRGGNRMLARLAAAAEPRRHSAFAAFVRVSPPPPPAAEAAADETAGDRQASEQAIPNMTIADPDAEPATESMMPSLDFGANPAVMESIVTLMATAFVSSIDAAACPDANDMIESLSPLSPENIARLAGASLGLAGTAQPNSAGNPLCPE